MKVSVIIPVYNVEKYLKQCLESVLNQTFEDMEVIIVNDGSTDRSEQIVQSYKKKFPDKIKTFFQENQGQSVARNVALDVAEGDYIVCIDSDDYIGAQFIETLYNEAIQKESDMVICNYTKVSEEGNIIKVYEANYMEKGIRIPSYISCNRLVRRELFEKYKIRYKEGVICEDIPVMLKLEAVAKNVQVISMAEYYYRTNPKSTTSTFKKRKLAMSQLPFEALEECVEFCLADNHLLAHDELEFFLCRIWTSLIFDIGRGCDKNVRKGMCKATIAFMNKYFPQYYKNKYVKLGYFHQLPRLQKIGTWLFVHAMHMHGLEFLAFVYAIV